MHEVRASGEPPSIRSHALWRVPEPDDEDGDVVCRVVAICVVEQLFRRLARIRDCAHEIDRALVVHDVPHLGVHNADQPRSPRDDEKGERTDAVTRQNQELVLLA